MTTSRIEGESFLPFDKYYMHDQITKLITTIITRFNQIVKKHVLFHVIFAFIGLLELILVVILFPTLIRSSMIAFGLSAFFFTAFLYLSLRIWLQAKKPEEFLLIRDDYIKGCQQLFQYREGLPEHHMAMASSAYRIAASLHEKETTFYHPPYWIRHASSLFERFSCWCHWHDVLRMKELFLLYSIEEHIKLVKCEPTNLEVHAALANAYVMLSSLYVDPRLQEGREEEIWTPSQEALDKLQEKFRVTAERAIEEFKILNDYAPDDPWVHAQLAYSYHDLQMPGLEIKEYETILKLRPDDKETLFKLGTLYFQQGMNAKGISIYEELKRSNYRKAEDLIKFYGAYTPQQLYSDLFSN